MDGFETRAIHAGQEPDPLTGAVVPPIYQVSTYAQDGVGGLRRAIRVRTRCDPGVNFEDWGRDLQAAAKKLGITAGMALLGGVLTSLSICLTIILTQSWHGRITLDSTEGVQKFIDSWESLRVTVAKAMA